MSGMPTPRTWWETGICVSFGQSWTPNFIHQKCLIFWFNHFLFGFMGIPLSLFYLPVPFSSQQKRFYSISRRILGRWGVSQVNNSMNFSICNLGKYIQPWGRSHLFSPVPRTLHGRRRKQKHNIGSDGCSTTDCRCRSMLHLLPQKSTRTLRQEEKRYLFPKAERWRRQHRWDRNRWLCWLGE